MNTSRNLPIWTSSPLLRVADSTRSRLTYVPLRLPTSRTVNPLPPRWNSACRRETVTSSRKMSLSGWRPLVVTSWSSRNRAPALGPRRTTSSAMPGGSDGTRPGTTSLSLAFPYWGMSRRTRPGTRCIRNWSAVYWPIPRFGRSQPTKLFTRFQKRRLPLLPRFLPPIKHFPENQQIAALRN